jgi:hypothetical protein
MAFRRRDRALIELTPTWPESNRMLGSSLVVDHNHMDAASRRFDLICLVTNTESRRGDARGTGREVVCLCRHECDHLTRRYHGDIDREWVMRELAKVAAKPGEYIGESYERWRLSGLPIWAALAAGMRPTPGSRMLIGRRPDLP